MVQAASWDSGGKDFWEELMHIGVGGLEDGLDHASTTGQIDRTQRPTMPFLSWQSAKLLHYQVVGRNIFHYERLLGWTDAAAKASWKRGMGYKANGKFLLGKMIVIVELAPTDGIMHELIRQYAHNNELNMMRACDAGVKIDGENDEDTKDTAGENGAYVGYVLKKMPETIHSYTTLSSFPWMLFKRGVL
jgi:hypothetical protein